MQDGRKEEAIAMLNSVIARRPDTADAYISLAHAYWEGGRPQVAISSLEHALSSGAPDRDVRIRLGIYLAETHADSAKAIKLLEGMSAEDVEALNGLGIAYGAFEAEIFRAGIQSIEKGQMEAARALGMNYFQAMRHVILPQAIRRILPVLGNDFVSMVKDSSLVSVLGVSDVTQLAKLYASSTFLFFQTYSILAFIYLVLTIMLTRVVRFIEARATLFRQ